MKNRPQFFALNAVSFDGHVQGVHCPEMKLKKYWNPTISDGQLIIESGRC